MDYVLELAVSPAVKRRVPDDKLREVLKSELAFLDDETSEKAKAFVAGEPYRATTEEIRAEWVFRYLAEPACVLACVADVGEVDQIVGEQARPGGINVDVNVSDAVGKLLTAERIDAVVRNTLARIERGMPVIDGRKAVACSHDYKEPEGEVATFTVYVKTNDRSPMVMHVGLPDEVRDVQAEFEAMAEETGARIEVNRSPADRAELRRKARKKAKKSQKKSPARD